MTIPSDAFGRPDYAQAHIGDAGGVDVAMTTLNPLAEQLNLPRVGLIKIDVEGAEALVLEGADRIIERDRPALICELQDVWSVRYGREAQSTLVGLANLGYAPAAFVDGRLQSVNEVTPTVPNYVFLPR
jgi:hypothetical protein